MRLFLRRARRELFLARLRVFAQSDARLQPHRQFGARSGLVLVVLDRTGQASRNGRSFLDVIANLRERRLDVLGKLGVGRASGAAAGDHAARVLELLPPFGRFLPLAEQRQSQYVRP